MKKFFSILFKILGTLIVLGVVAVFALGYYFNPERVKPMVVTYVKDNYNRSISIGDVSWKVFPRLGISIKDITLGNAPGFGEGNFALFKGASIFVNTMELFSGKVHVQSLALNKPTIDLKVNAQGKDNWSDLAAAPKESTTTAGKADEHTSDASGISDIEFNIESVEIIDGAFTYQDQQTGEKFEVKNMNFSSQNVALGKDFPVDLKLNITSNAPALNADVSAKGMLKVADNVSTYDLNAITLVADLAMSNLQANGIRLSNFKTPLKLDKSIIDLSAISANLYGGSMNGSVKINAQNQPADTQVAYDLKGTDISSLLKDLGQKQTFSGKLNMKGNLRFKAHPEKKKLSSSLNGTAAMSINNGALNGVDLAFWYNTGLGLLKSRNATDLALGAVQAVAGGGGKNTGKTAFIGARANFKLNGGILTNNDLNVFNQHVFGLGGGTVNLVNETIDYHFNISGVAKTGDGYKPAGQVIPLKITGSLDNPKMGVDITPVVGNVLQNIIPQKESKGGNNADPIAPILNQIFKK